MTSRSLILFAIAVIGVPISCSGQTVPSADAVYPDSTWMQYASPDEAGWSTEAIETIRHFADSLGARAVMLVHGGAIVTEWGWTRDPAPVRSIRKSLFSALLGIAVEEGAIDTTATIADLGIDDTPPLLDIEKQARVIDLLTTSSGVYHEAAAEPAGMRKPERGSAIPARRGTITTGTLTYSVRSTSRKRACESSGHSSARLRSRPRWSTSPRVRAAIHFNQTALNARHIRFG